MKYKKSKSNLVCNMCDGEMYHIEIEPNCAKSHEVTNAWICQDCPNMQLEFYGNKDLQNLDKYLRGEI